MVADAHLVALEDRHAKLENLIAEENNRPHPDEIMISQWKKEKLRLKDTINDHMH